MGECNYGGRVTDDKDRIALHCILDTCYCAANMAEGAPLSESGKYFVPPDGTHGEYMAFADSLPLVSDPEVSFINTVGRPPDRIARSPTR